ncbi:MAG: hypothetical protein ACTHLE_22000 [Agriterribacter sp.]
MQTILGANGQIGEELARELKKRFTADIRIVSRRAKKINDTDEVFSAYLSIPANAIEAVKGSEVAYFTLGLPINSSLWAEQFPLILLLSYLNYILSRNILRRQPEEDFLKIRLNFNFSVSEAPDWALHPNRPFGRRFLWSW